MFASVGRLPKCEGGSRGSGDTHLAPRRSSRGRFATCPPAAPPIDPPFAAAAAIRANNAATLACLRRECKSSEALMTTSALSIREDPIGAKRPERNEFVKRETKGQDTKPAMEKRQTK